MGAVNPGIDEPVHLAGPREDGPALFERERLRLTPLLPAGVEVEHIGSTAVPGLVAKPIVDMQIGVARYPPPTELVQALEASGYVGFGEAGVPGRAYFVRRGAEPFNVHVVAAGGRHWADNLALRDHLRRSAQARGLYAQAKRAAVDGGSATLLAYSAAKAPVLAALLAEARLAARRDERPPEPPMPDVPGHAVHRLAASDADEWAAFAVLPQVQLHTSSDVSSAADLLPMIERSRADDPNAPWLFGVREPATNALVATFGFHTVSALNKTAEVTYQVCPQRWGRGLATAICNAAVRWAFDVRGWVRVQATVLEPNVASQRVLQKCGFAFEGRLRNLRLVRGEPRDYMLFAQVPVPSTTLGPDWERRLADAWQALDALEPAAFVARIDALANELPAGHATGLFEQAAARDSTGQPDLAVPLYRTALDTGLAGMRRRRAVIQMASSLRNLGQPARAAALLEAERQAPADALDDAVDAFLALALADLGREREAAGLALAALSRHLPRYNRSLARYAAELAGPPAGEGA